MSLDLIIGTCGSGKTTECVERIMRLEEKGENVIYIVPQQFTHESEKLLVEKSGRGVIMHTRVLSFHRLAYAVMSDSDEHKPVLSALGRAFLVRKIVYENKEKLSYFSKVIDKQGFLDSLINLFTEFGQYEITPEKLLDAYEKTDKSDSLSLKLKDMYIIYGDYRERIKEKYAASEETLDILAKSIKDSRMIKNSHVFIDSMDYFIPQEYEVIKQLMLHAKSVCVTLDGDFSNIGFGKYSIYDPYFESKQTASRLVRLAEECGCSVSKPTFLEGCVRHKDHSDLLHLQKHYFGNETAVFSGRPENLHILRALNTYSEIDMVCRKIIETIKKKNIRYDSIGVIIDKTYETAVKSRFAQFGIPVFIDSSRPVTKHPLTALILSVLDIVCCGYKNILTYAKNYFSPVLDEDVYYLENYILKNGLGAKAWYLKEWRFGLDEESEEFAIVNSAKDDIVNSLEKIRGDLIPNKKYTVEHIIGCIYDFLFEIGADKQLAELAENSKDDQNAYRQHTRIWEELTVVFETMSDMTDTMLDTAEFTTILRSGLDLCGISIIPPTQDHVIIGDIDRSRLPEINTLFILGVNEGRIPPYAESIGLFADRERTFLTENYFEMAADDLRRINQMDFNIYALMLKPNTELYLSSTAFEGGKRAVQSSVISRLLKLFPDAEIEEADDSLVPPAPKPAFGRLVKDIRKISESVIPEQIGEIYEWFSRNEEYASQMAMIDAAFADELSEYRSNNFTLSQASLKKLYNDAVNGSVSRLEKFAECPFAYFLNYGLGVSDREVYRFDPLRLGNLFHSVLQDFSEDLKAEEKDWRDLDKIEVAERVGKSVDGMIPEAFNEVVSADPMFVYTVKRVKNIISKSVDALCSHVRSGLFEPSDFEVEFGIGKVLPPIVFEFDGGKKMILNGKIDRVDILKSEKGDYVKIIDYKSSEHQFSKTELYYGLQLQLLLYMDTYIRSVKAAKAKELLPGGVFYFKVSNPMVENNSGEADIEKLVLEQFDMNGLVLNESTVIDAIGEKTEPKSKTSKAKIETLKKSDMIDRDGFLQLCSDAEEITKILGGRMLDGEIFPEPVKCGDRTGCDYCAFGRICRFDVRENAGYRTNEILVNESKKEE